MKAFSLTFAAAAALLAMLGTAAAQDTPMQGHDMAAMNLPEPCQIAEAPAMHDMGNMQSMMEGMGDHQKALMQSMMATGGPMMNGMMAEDADVAFACAMIPHHQGAINMAKVELEHGDSEEMRQLAQKVIDTQAKEIETLTKWIEEQGQ